jgi:hypothetical protein
MWGFQYLFRQSLESRAARAFERIGFGAGPRAYLVGFATKPDLAHQVCFESETDPLSAVDLSGVESLAQHLYENDPESRIWNTYMPAHDRRQAHLRDRARAKALSQTLEASAQGADRYFFVGQSGTVEGKHQVHPILSFPRRRWDTKPALRTELRSRFSVQRSLQHALVQELLSTATGLLLRQEPPEGFDFISERDDELIRKASRKLTQDVAVLAGLGYTTDLHEALDAVASQPYEGRVGFGRIILAEADHPETDFVLRFLEPIRLGSARQFRKALEMTGDGLYLLCDGALLLGLGTVMHPPLDQEPPTINPNGVKVGKETHDRGEYETIFEIDVLGRGAWELSYRKVPLLRVSNTLATLPQPPLDEATFIDTTSRLFPEANGIELEALWRLADDAASAEHGTMLVVHRDAANEADRLFPQAQRVEPGLLASETLRAVTAIDGAVLVDPSAQCHAVGVILDGHATGIGDPGRGARYNSAVRYQQAVGADCMVVIVSEDGMIDLIPRLERRISRDEVEKPLTDLQDALTTGPNYEAFFRAWDHLESLAFYLTQPQCDRANTARSALEEHRAQQDPDLAGTNLGQITHVSWSPLEPSPEMNDSYYVP